MRSGLGHSAIRRLGWCALLTVVAVLACQAQNPQVVPGQRGRRTAPELQSTAPPAPADTGSSDANAAPAAGTDRKLSFDINLPGETHWLDTGVDVRAGDRLQLSTDGSIQFTTGEAAGPDGAARSWTNVLQSLPLNSAGLGAVIGRVGDSNTVVPFLVGAKKEVVVSRAGRLFLGINGQSDVSAAGAYKVKLQITPGSPANAAKAEADIKLASDLLDQVPRRVADRDGNPGDMVNFIIVGPEDKMREAFASAGWVQVDRTPAEGVLHAIIATTSKQAYTQMPMSELYLFGRPQDYGFAHAEPLEVVASRHHLRVWKAPFEVNGQPAWIGAATHDIGFEKDQRNGQTTHKIDPAVDNERDFVAASLTNTGAFSGSSYALPSSPVQDARTATGGSFHSDGRILILPLR